MWLRKLGLHIGHRNMAWIRHRHTKDMAGTQILHETDIRYDTQYVACYDFYFQIMHMHTQVQVNVRRQTVL